VGRVTPTEGGFRLSGRWPFSSGSDHCQWVFVGAFVPTPEGQPPDMRTFLVPRADYRVEDTWHTSGLRATGSNDVVIEDAFVPDWRTHRFTDGFRCKSPGNEVNLGPLYRLPFGQVFVRSVSTSAIGIAQGALDLYREGTRAHVSRADAGEAVLEPDAQVALAEAEARLDAIRLVFRRDFDVMLEAVRDGRRISVEDRVGYRYNSARVTQQCLEIVDTMFALSGGRAIYSAHPLNRYFQDIHAARAHYANNPTKSGRNMGRVRLGMRTQDYFI